MIKDITYLVISDIHLGHARNKTRDIIDHLNSFFDNNKKAFSKLDIIFIAGDLYDKLLHHSSDEALLAIAWLSNLANFCGNNNIKLRILEGTPSHDWHQAKVFDKALHKLDINVDFKYIETLHIEFMEDLGISILYVPDEWRPNTIDTYKEVKELLLANNIDKVDTAIMHGMFRYQLPNGIEMDCFEEEDYLSITKHFINIGHIHTPSVNNRIIAQGSFDRLAHNEEEKKGGVIVSISDTKEDTYKFIENKEATLFLSKVIKTKSLDCALETLERFLSDLKPQSHVMLRFTRDNPLNTVINDIKKKYPMFRFKKKIIDDIGNDDNNTLLNKALSGKKINIPVITKSNIVELIEKEIIKYQLPENKLNVLRNELLEIVNDP
jgi:DNA repair exonuclease SbcCD nuclease subunit